MIAVGLTDGVIRRRLDSGRWRRLFPGTYATFTGAVSRDALQWAAVLYAGSDAVLSHETAAVLWNIGDESTRASRRTGAEPVHVSVPRGRNIRRQPGLIIHQSKYIEYARHPVLLPPRTRVEETVVDLTQTARSVESAVGWMSMACERRLTTASRILEALGRRTRLRWRQEIFHALGGVARGCHSPLEWRFWEKVERSHGLPRGERQVCSRPDGNTRYEDVTYAEYGLVVELDGRVGHGEETRGNDRRRDNATILSGRLVLRFGWDDLAERACEIAEEVATILNGEDGTGWRMGAVMAVMGDFLESEGACRKHAPREKRRLKDQLQVVPLRVKEVGAVLVPVQLARKPKVADPPLAERLHSRWCW